MRRQIIPIGEMMSPVDSARAGHLYRRKPRGAPFLDAPTETLMAEHAPRGGKPRGLHHSTALSIYRGDADGESNERGDRNTMASA